VSVGNVDQNGVIAVLQHPDEANILERSEEGFVSLKADKGATAAQALARPPLPWINMTTWDDDPIPEQDWTVLNRFPRKQSALLSGEGAAGKSTLVLHLCAAHSVARDWLGVMPEPGPAIFIDAEDDQNVMHRRLAALTKYYGVSVRDMIEGG